jgi:hypothetical protein
MWWSRVGVAVKWTMVAVAITAGLAMVHWQILIASRTVYVPVSAAVAGLFALGAMRHPWFFLAVAVLLWLAMPTVFDSSANDLFVGCYQLSWLLGAIAGKIIRSLRNRAGRRAEHLSAGRAEISSPGEIEWLEGG